MEQFIDASYVEIKYFDNDGYTIPMLFTKKRFNSVMNDLSVEKLRFTHSNGLVFEIKPI